jgi:hypothetical protein
MSNRRVVGTIIQMRTNTKRDLGTDGWGLGPSFIALQERQKGGP